jgi:hypothetical protein
MRPGASVGLQVVSGWVMQVGGCDVHVADLHAEKHVSSIIIHIVIETKNFRCILLVGLGSFSVGSNISSF